MASEVAAGNAAPVQNVVLSVAGHFGAGWLDFSFCDIRQIARYFQRSHYRRRLRGVLNLVEDSRLLAV